MDPDGVGALGRIAFVSDVHLKPESPEQRRPFVEFLNTQARGLEALYLLGDIFDYWLGPRHLASEDYRDVLEEIRACVRSGVRVFFVPGNRDYFVERRFEEFTGVRVAGESVSIEVAGRRLFGAHGDFVFNRNPKYAAYRRLMRFGLMRSLYLALPRVVGRGIVRGFRRISVRTTPPVRWSDEALLEGARPFFRRGADVLVCGHIHAPRHLQERLDGRVRDLFVLGDWEGGSREWLEFDGSFRLRPWR